MENFNLNKVAKHIKLQKKARNKVVKKRAGRPKVQPKIRIEIRLDSILKAKFDKYNKENGQRGPSAVIVPLIKELLISEGYY